MRQNYKTWVVVDPEVQEWKDTLAESIQGAAEQAALDYDARADVDYALAKESVLVQVVVKSPSELGKGYSFDVTCTLAPFYEITSPSAVLDI